MADRRDPKPKPETVEDLLRRLIAQNETVIEQNARLEEKISLLLTGLTPYQGD